MSAAINIAGSIPVEDPSYRYKMPRIIAKVEGRGNGIKTVLVNIVEIAAALNREAPEITKFFGCELGSQTTYAVDTDRAIVNGAHNAADLQNHLTGYIEKFVLCRNCRLPEAHYKFKAGLISQKCLACGHKDTIDMAHKLTTFILAQYKKAKEQKTEKAEKKKEKKEKKARDEADALAAGGEEAVAAAAAAAADGTVKEKKSKKKDKSSKKKSSDGDQDSNEGEDIAATVAVLDDEENDSSAADEAINRFRLWVQENPSAPVASLLEELRVVQTFASLRVQDRVIIFLGAKFTENFVTANEIMTQKEILSSLAPSAVQQRHLIGGFEWLCATRFPATRKFFPVVLKQLFDEELVEEEVFYEWSADTVKNEHSADQSMISYEDLEELRSSAGRFITWLQEAEEEGEEGEEEEEGEEDANED